MSFQLRQLHINDAPFIDALFQDSKVMKYIGPVLSACKAGKLCQNMMQEQSRNRACYWVVTRLSDGKQVGLCSGHWRSTTATITLGIMVAKKYQNQGVFNVAQAKSIELVKKKFPVKYLNAFTHHQNDAAKYCYQKIGFKPEIVTAIAKDGSHLIKWSYVVENHSSYNWT